MLLTSELQFLCQLFLTKDNNPGQLVEDVLLAVGGRYDYLLHQMWGREYVCHASLICFKIF